MEDLIEECLKSIMVHVSRQREDEPFPEHMSLKEVIRLLKQLQSATQENARTHSQILLDMYLATDSEDGNSNPLNLSKVSGGIRSPGVRQPPFSLSQKDKCPESEGGDSHGIHSA